MEKQEMEMEMETRMENWNVIKLLHSTGLIYSTYPQYLL